MFNAVSFGIIGCFLSITSATLAASLQPQDGGDLNGQISIESTSSFPIAVAEPIYLYIHSSHDIESILEHLDKIFQDLNIKDLKQWYRRELKPIGLVLRIPVIKGQEYRYAPLLERYGVYPTMKKMGTAEENIMKWEATTPDSATTLLANKVITESPIPVEGSSKLPIGIVEDDDPVDHVETVTIENAYKPLVQVELSNPEIRSHMENDERIVPTFSGNSQAVLDVGKEHVPLPNIVASTPKLIGPNQEKSLIVTDDEILPVPQVDIVKGGRVPLSVVPTEPPRTVYSSIEEATISTISTHPTRDGDQIEAGVPITPSVVPPAAIADNASPPELAPPSSNLILPQTTIAPTKNLYNTNERVLSTPDSEVPEWVYTNALYSQLRYSLAQLYQLFPHIAQMAGYTNNADCLPKRATSDFYSEISLKDWVNILRKVETQNWDVMETRPLQFADNGDIASSY